MPLPRKQTMNGNVVSSTIVMVSLSHFKKKCKGDLIVIVALEFISCPCCGGELFTRGTCRRQAINSAGDVDHYQLRVLQCRNCLNDETADIHHALIIMRHELPAKQPLPFCLIHRLADTPEILLGPTFQFLLFRR